MKLAYTGETISGPDGKLFPVLNEPAVDFKAAAEGRKSAETYVLRAQGGEAIETKNTTGQKENGDVHIAKSGDAIFQNLHNPDDRYVPNNSLKFDALEQSGYEIVRKEAEDRVFIKSKTKSKILVEAVSEPICIKDAWGAGQHQFLYPGATLKLNDNGKVTGIDKSAFDATWEVSKPALKL